MAEWVAIQKTTHQHTRWENHTHYKFAQASAVVPVLLAELSQLLPYYPLAFVKSTLVNTNTANTNTVNTNEATQESYQLVALLSIQPNVNYYITSQGKWRVPYVPSTLRSHPFTLVEKTPQEFILCLDQTSEFVSLSGEASHTQPLFNTHNKNTPTETQELAEPTAQVLNFLQQCQANKQHTQQTVNLLAKHNLITPWNIQQATDNPQAANTPVNGIFQINTETLQTLSGEALTELNQHHALELAHAQLLSKPRLRTFTELAKLHQQEQQTADSAENLDLDQIFGEQDNDMFKF